MNDLCKYVGKVTQALLENEAYTAVKYISEKTIVRATRKLYNRKIDKRGNTEIVLTIGKPNYLERDFIKDCKKAGVPFPVRDIQLKFPPKQKK